MCVISVLLFVSLMVNNNNNNSNNKKVRPLNAHNRVSVPFLMKYVMGVGEVYWNHCVRLCVRLSVCPDDI